MLAILVVSPMLALVAMLVLTAMRAQLCVLGSVLQGHVSPLAARFVSRYFWHCGRDLI